jgi:hypothetical protein
MLKRIGIPVLVVTLALSGATLADAKKKTNHKINLKSDLATVTTAGNRVVDAGVVTGTFGDGAIIIRSTVAGTTITFKAIVWYVKGTVTSTGTLQAAAQPDGSTTYTGTGKVTRGTGRFRGARGPFQVTGTSPPNDISHATLQATGTLRY